MYGKIFLKFRRYYYNPRQKGDHKLINANKFNTIIIILNYE
ncbi:hypothetical protein ZPR_2990 [Zunongwangia profunda SM-A87]|uniref:Uncharacterized protein n=1 Tax=Zunongwangia profunda (strain DSM 18752 / CCTCC AB 206139 / SM-A87) TaxID=655815 RepID=D5BGX8_ZUNPS|nr:hypothetical protein ZPR_2990 [Zunongwangia profunda SM-A87]